MRMGYNTNGLAHHSLDDAIDLLASIGYESVAITVDHYALNPFRDDLEKQLESVVACLSRYRMSSVVETGARYLLDPRRKHSPTFFDADRSRRRKRMDFLKRTVDIAVALSSDCVSIWSGRRNGQLTESEHWRLLSDALTELLDYAGERNVVIGFEPEPDMFIDTMAGFDQLSSQAGLESLRLTLDVGHVHCQGEGPISEVIRQWSDQLVNIHIEDMVRGVHEHLMFGEGEMDFPPILTTLQDVGYHAGVHVELSRHSHQGVAAAANAYAFLQSCLPDR